MSEETLVCHLNNSLVLQNKRHIHDFETCMFSSDNNFFIGSGISSRTASGYFSQSSLHHASQCESPKHDNSRKPTQRKYQCKHARATENGNSSRQTVDPVTKIADATDAEKDNWDSTVCHPTESSK